MVKSTIVCEERRLSMDFDDTNIDFEFLIDDFIQSYRFYHSQEETERLVFDMLEGKHIPILPSYLDVLGVNLKIKLADMIQKNYECTHDSSLERYIDLINKQNDELARNNHKKSKRFKLKRMTTLGVITAVCLSGVSTKKAVEGEVTFDSKIKMYQDLNFYVEDSDLKKNERMEQEKKEKINNERKRKNKILNNYKKCNSIEDIIKRQKQLESIKWEKSDKIYPECKLNPSIQRFIYEQSVLNEWPVDFTFSIIYAETRGGFTSSGEVSYNAPNNYDLGLTQQNTISSLKTFRDKYKISYDKAFKLLKNNDYANICSAFLEYKEIASRFDKYDPYEFAGCYNGWLNWRENSVSKAYVKEFKKGYNKAFTKHHNVEKVIKGNK